MRVLVTGISGMLGSYLARNWRVQDKILGSARMNPIGVAKKNFLSFDFEVNDIQSLVSWAKADTIIHCAALTDLRACENNPELATRINATSVEQLLSSSRQSRLVFISSDAVFSGDKYMPDETYPPAPRSEYGKSKVLGEQYIAGAVARSSACHVAVRTTPVGRNPSGKRLSFVDWLIDSVKNETSITLYQDVCFSPISVSRLKNSLEVVLDSDARGIWHIAAREPVTKYQFGMTLIEELGLPRKFVSQGKIEGEVGSHMRSINQSLNCSKFERVFGEKLPDYRETVRDLVQMELP